MPRWFDFSDGEYQFKSLGELEVVWNKVPDRLAISAIAEAHQYFDFLQTMIINRLQSWSHAECDREHWFTPTPLVLSGRAGAISSCVVVGTSIIECALRAHGENRNLRKLMKKDPRHRTFGAILYAWEKHGVFCHELHPILEDLKKVQGKRNDIHLYASFGNSWENVVKEEMDLLESIERIFIFLQELEPV